MSDQGMSLLRTFLWLSISIRTEAGIFLEWPQLCYPLLLTSPLHHHIHYALSTQFPHWPWRHPDRLSLLLGPLCGMIFPQIACVCLPQLCQVHGKRNTLKEAFPTPPSSSLPLSTTSDLASVMTDFLSAWRIFFNIFVL